VKNHYTYWLTCDQTDQHYIGCRSSTASPEQDNYWSSSEVVKQMIKEGYTFTKNILSTWPTREDAMAHEVLLHDYFNVGQQSDFINQAKQTSTRFDSTGLKCPGKGLGRKDTNKVRKNKSLAAGHHLRGKQLSDDHKNKISATMKIKAGHSHTLETRQKLSAIKKGCAALNKGTKKPKIVCRLSDRKEMDLGNFLRWS
jgi:hypothetical protein